LDCHDEAHSKRQNSLNLTPERISSAKETWESEVADRSQAQMLASRAQILETRQWVFINFPLVKRLCDQRNIDTSVLKDLQCRGTVNEDGLPPGREKASQSERAIFDHMYVEDMWRLYSAYQELLEALISSANPLDLAAIWTSTRLKNLMEPGQLCFINRGIYIKPGEGQDKEEVRHAHYRKRSVELRFQLDCWYILNSSGFNLHLRGCNKIACLLLARSFERNLHPEQSMWILKATPIALGYGFWHSEDITPLVHHLKNPDGFSMWIEEE
jgi:hypothetical protein